MNNNKPQSRVRVFRPLLAVVCLAVGLSLLFGALSPSTASARLPRTNVKITSTSPAIPVAGQSYTITFALKRGLETLPADSFDCFAMSNYRPVPLTSKTFNSTSASCTWAIPAGSAGRLIDGLLVAKVGTVTYFRGWQATIS